MKHETVPAVVEALLDGRAKVARGWCQNYFTVPRPESMGGDLVCPIEAVGRDWVAVRYLALALPGRQLTVSYYNDLPTTTQADILALYDRAIEIALAQ